MAESSSSAPICALLLATQRWPTGARLGLALAAAGFRVSLWGPHEHPLLATKACAQHFPSSMFEPMASLESAVLAAKPRLIVPCDDLATQRLQALGHDAMTNSGKRALLSLIEQAIGSPEELGRLTARSYVLGIAAEEGIAVPLNAPVQTPVQLRTWLDANGFPAFLKADGTSGGIGVRPIHNYEQARTTLRTMDTPPHPLRALKRFTFDRDSTLLGPLVRRERPAISVQRAVPGRDANSALFCWRGKVLASISVEVLATAYMRGPSTVLRRIEHPAMDRAADVLAARLGLSGFYGLDFILEEQTGAPWLLEMNGRATQISHLALGAGHDLAAAAFSAVTDTPLHPRAIVTQADTIALFPQEWQRDPASPLLKTAFHDVPWDAPGFVRFYVNQRGGWRRLLSHQYWRERRSGKQILEGAATSKAASRIP